MFMLGLRHAHLGTSQARVLQRSTAAVAVARRIDVHSVYDVRPVTSSLLSHRRQHRRRCLCSSLTNTSVLMMSHPRRLCRWLNKIRRHRVYATVHHRVHRGPPSVDVNCWYCRNLIDSSRPRPHGLDAAPHRPRPRPPIVTLRNI